MHANTKQVISQYRSDYDNDLPKRIEQMASEIAEAREILRQIKNSCLLRYDHSLDKSEREHLQVIIDNARTFLEVHEPQPSH